MTHLTKRACLTKPTCQGHLVGLDCQERLMLLAPLAPLVGLEVLVRPEGLLDPLGLLGLAGREIQAVGLPPGWV